MSQGNYTNASTGLNESLAGIIGAVCETKASERGSGFMGSGYMLNSAVDMAFSLVNRAMRAPHDRALPLDSESEESEFKSEPESSDDEVKQEKEWNMESDDGASPEPALLPQLNAWNFTERKEHAEAQERRNQELSALMDTQATRAKERSQETDAQLRAQSLQLEQARESLHALQRSFADLRRRQTVSRPAAPYPAAEPEVEPEVEEEAVPFMSCGRAVAGLEALVRMWAPSTNPNLTPVIAVVRSEVEEVISQMEARMGVSFAMQAMATAMRELAEADAQIDTLEMKIAEIKAGVRNTRELMPTYTMVRRMRLTASSKTSKRAKAVTAVSCRQEEAKRARRF